MNMKIIVMNLLLLLNLQLVQVTFAVIDTSICSPARPTPSSPNELFPTMPKTYQAEIEVNIVNQNRTVIVEEYSNEYLNEVVIKMKSATEESSLYVNTSTRELLVVNPQTGDCKVSSMTTSKPDFLKYSVRSLQRTFEVSKNFLIFQGESTVRGILVKKWYSCVYWGDMDATLNVTWYFADPDLWWSLPDLGLTSVPVRARVKGYVGSTTNPHTFEHIYDIFNFRGGHNESRQVEMPKFTYCPGRQIQKKMPSNLPTSYTVSKETIFSQQPSNTVIRSSCSQEWYNGEMNWHKMTYREALTLQHQQVSEFNDYSDGLSYTINVKSGVCTIAPISSDVMKDLIYIKYNASLMTPKELFHMDTNNVSYSGTRVVRGLLADVFVGHILYPENQPMNVSIEWLFAITVKHETPYQKLIQMNMVVQELSILFTYNIFNFKQLKGNLDNWDIRPCFINATKRHFKFSIPGNYTSLVSRDTDRFKQMVMMSVAVAAKGFSALRVTDVAVAFGKVITIYFDLNSMPSVNDVTNNQNIRSLSDAADLVAKHLASSGAMLLYISPTSGGITFIPIVPSSFEEVVPSVNTTPTKPVITSTSTSQVTPSPTMKDIPLPRLPTYYEVSVQKIISDHQKSIYTHEISSSAELTTRTTAAGVHSRVYVNGNAREAFYVDPDIYRCQVENLTNGPLFDQIGYKIDSTGRVNVFSLAGVLQFSNRSDYVFNGYDDVRGIHTMKWRLNNYNVNDDKTTNVDAVVHFTDPNTWDSALNWPYTPVQIQIWGINSRVHPTNYYDDIYDYFHFRNSIITKDPFKTPDMVMCYGRTPHKAIPKISDSATFTMETLYDDGTTVSKVQGMYDTKMKISKFVYKPLIAGQSISPGFVTEIHDFNTGVAYIVNKYTGSCRTRPIESYSYDDIQSNLTFVRMLNAHQLLLGTTDNCSYEGVTMTRSIPTDRFVCVVGNHTVEYRFATGDYSRIQSREDMYEFGVPVQIMKRLPKGRVVIHNYYNFVQTTMEQFDVSQCYIGRSRRIIQFSVPGSNKGLISNGIALFKTDVLNTLSHAAFINVLRISNLQIRMGASIDIRLTLLDVAPVFSDDINPKNETSLADAAAMLRAAVTHQALSISFTNKVIKPIPSSYREISEDIIGNITTTFHTSLTSATGTRYGGSTSPTTGFTGSKSPGTTSRFQNCKENATPRFSTGVVVGVSVAMVIIGGGIGITSAIFFFRSRRSRTFER